MQILRYDKYENYDYHVVQVCVIGVKLFFQSFSCSALAAESESNQARIA